MTQGNLEFRINRYCVVCQTEREFIFIGHTLLRKSRVYTCDKCGYLLTQIISKVGVKEDFYKFEGDNYPIDVNKK